MKPNVKLALAAMLLLCSTHSAQGQGKDPITGTWSGYIGRSEATPSPARFDFKMSPDGSLAGTASSPQATMGDISTGSYDVKTGALKFTVAMRAPDASGNKRPVFFEGHLLHDTASGSMTLGEEKGLFRLTKGDVVPNQAALKARAEVGEDAATAAARRGFVEVSGWILRAAEMVPPEKYSYRPVGTVRTFGELVAHVVDGSNYYCGKGAGKNIEWSDAAEKKITGKPAIVTALKQAFADCTKAYDGGKAIAPLMENVAHSSLHYGNIVTYLRMMGMVPPSS